MKIKTIKGQLPYKFIITALIICGAIFTVENINGRFWLNDFKVYYLAAKALLNGDPIYGVSFGLKSGLYKYSPFSLFLFLPYTIFSFKVASILHFLIITFSAIATLIIIKKLITGYIFISQKVKENLLLVIVFIGAINHITRELHLGNINIIILLLTSLAVLLMLKDRQVFAGILFGIVMVTKPYFLILILPLLAYKKRDTVISLILSILFFILVPTLFFGVTENITIHKEWFGELMAHSSALESFQTFGSLTRRYIYHDIPDNFHYYAIAVVSLLYILYFWLKNQQVGDNNNSGFRMQNANLIIDCFLLIAIIPNLIITDDQHFLLSIPIIAILLWYVYLKKNYFLIGGFVLLMICYGGDSPDILGSQLSRQVENMGILGISNLIMIAAVIFLTLRKEIHLNSLDKK